MGRGNKLARTLPTDLRKKQTDHWRYSRTHLSVGPYSVHEDLLCFIAKIRESKIVLYSEFHGMDSGFLIPSTGFRIL